MIKIKAVITFYDIDKQVQRDANDVWEISKSRLESLLHTEECTNQKLIEILYLSKDDDNNISSR